MRALRRLRDDLAPPVFTALMALQDRREVWMQAWAQGGRERALFTLKTRALPAGLWAAAGLGLMSLAGSIGDVRVHTLAAPPRVAALAQGGYGPAAFERVRGAMDGAAIAVADRAGAPDWTPPRVPGWPVYDIERGPSLGFSNLTFDKARRINAHVPVSPLPAPPVTPFRLTAAGAGAEDRRRAHDCLTQAVYYEAGFEPVEGQRAVAQVVLNRMRHPAYPNSVCGVVYEGSLRRTGCQFSFTCDGALSRAPEARAWAQARDVARQALEGYVHAPVGAATHYHADYVFPYWGATLVKLRRIGVHIFYRMTGPAGSPVVLTARYGGRERAISRAVLTGGDTLTPDASGETAPRTVSLAVAGQVRTYRVADAAAPGGGRLRVAGTLTPTRRKPTPEEVAAVNAALARIEARQAPSALD